MIGTIEVDLMGVVKSVVDGYGSTSSLTAAERDVIDNPMLPRLIITLARYVKSSGFFFGRLHPFG